MSKQLLEVLETLKAETEQSVILMQRLIAYINQSSQLHQGRRDHRQKQQRERSK